MVGSGSGCDTSRYLTIAPITQSCFINLCCVWRAKINSLTHSTSSRSTDSTIQNQRVQNAWMVWIRVEETPALACNSSSHDHHPVCGLRHHLLHHLLTQRHRKHISINQCNPKIAVVGRVVNLISTLFVACNVDP